VPTRITKDMTMQEILGEGDEERWGRVVDDPVQSNLEARRGMRSAGGGPIWEDHHAKIRVHVRKVQEVV
jgi:hypothetical protein